MPAMLMHHQRADFDRWHMSFRRHTEVRRAYGALTETILRNALAPDDVWVLIEWDDLYRAQLFARSDDLLDQLDLGGITVSPDVWFLESVTPGSEAEESSPEGGDPVPAGDG